MPSIGEISTSSTAVVSRVTQSRLAAQAATNELQAQVQQAKAEAAPGTSPTVQYRYATAPDGTQIPVEAIIKTTKPNDSPLATPRPTISGTPLVSLSPTDEIDTFGLTPDERRVVRELQSRDLEVRNHEAQHFHAASGLASGGPEFTFQVGPDGNVYAIGGHVDLQAAATSDPEKSARNAQTFALAASAPGDASAQDNSVARTAISNSSNNERKETTSSVDISV